MPSIDVEKTGSNIKKITTVNCNPRFPFCKRDSIFEIDIRFLHLRFHICKDFPVFMLE